MKKVPGTYDKLRYLYYMMKELGSKMWTGTKDLAKNTMEANRLRKLQKYYFNRIQII